MQTVSRIEDDIGVNGLKIVRHESAELPVGEPFDIVTVAVGETHPQLHIPAQAPEKIEQSATAVTRLPLPFPDEGIGEGGAGQLDTSLQQGVIDRTGQIELTFTLSTGEMEQPGPLFLHQTGQV